MNEIGFDRFRIQLICDFPCEDKYQLRQKEGEYIRQMGTLNINIAGRDKAEYNEDNKEHKRNYMKHYHVENREHRLEYLATYRQENKDIILSKAKEYFQKNKEKISQNVSQKVDCECGSCIRKGDILKHKRTQKHITFINSIPTMIEITLH